MLGRSCGVGDMPICVTVEPVLTVGLWLPAGRSELTALENAHGE
jgi:hypothetical protein